MRTDNYTKAILTIIAVALVWIAVGGPALMPTVRAQAILGERVTVVGWEDRAGVRHNFPPPMFPELAKERGMGLPMAEDSQSPPRVR